MANRPVFQARVGSVEMAKWAGEFEGKPTTSFSMKKQKFNKTSGKFEDSPFLTVTDLKDIKVACDILLQNHYAPQDKDPVPTGDQPFTA